MASASWRIYPDPDDESAVFYQEESKTPTRHECFVDGRVLGFVEQAWGEESYYLGLAPPTEREVRMSEIENGDSTLQDRPVSQRFRDLKKAKLFLIAKIRDEQTEHFKKSRRRYQDDMIALDELEDLVKHPDHA